MWSWFCKKYSCQILQKSSACISIETANNWILLCSQKYNERGLNLNFFSPYRCLQYWLGCRADTIRSLLSPTTLLCNGEQLANIKGICRKYEKRFGANMKEIWRKYQTDSAQILKRFVVNITGICKYCHSLLCCQTSTFFNTYFRHILNFMTMMLGHLFKWQSSGQELLPSGKFCRRKTCFTRTPRELNPRQQQFRECSESVTKHTRKRDEGRKKKKGNKYAKCSCIK